MVLAERFISLCKHHTHTVFEAIPRISRVLAFVKDTNLVYPVVYPNVSHIIVVFTTRMVITEYHFTC